MHFGEVQVRISWQWQRHLLNNIARSNEVALRINLDETTIPLNHDGQKGVVSNTIDKDIVLVRKKSPKRGSLTLVTIVRDDPSVQPLLPQMIIGNQYIAGGRPEKAGTHAAQKHHCGAG